MFPVAVCTVGPVNILTGRANPATSWICFVGWFPGARISSFGSPTGSGVTKGAVREIDILTDLANPVFRRFPLVCLSRSCLDLPA